MKKDRKNALVVCTTLLAIAILIVLAVILLLPKSHSFVGGEIERNDNYYVLSYEASYNSNDFLPGNDTKYKIIDSTAQLNSILGNHLDGEVSVFDDDFFRSKNLLVTFGKVGAVIDNLELGGADAEVTIHHDCPLGTDDDVYTFKAFLIPIEKTITDASITSSCYTDRLY